MKILTISLVLLTFLFGCKSSMKGPVVLAPKTVASQSIKPIQTNYLSKEIILIFPSKTNIIKQSVVPTNGKVDIELKIVSEGSTNKVWLMEEKTEIVTNNFLYLYFGSALTILGVWALWKRKPAPRTKK